MNENKGFNDGSNGIIILVLGILSFALSVVSCKALIFGVFVAVAGFVLGIVAVSLSKTASDHSENGKVIAGRVLGILGIVVSVVSFLYDITCTGCILKMFLN